LRFNDQVAAKKSLKKVYIKTPKYAVHRICINHPKRKPIKRSKGGERPCRTKSLIEERAEIVEKDLTAAAELAVDETRIRARLNVKISQRIETRR
jgi:hypothetical protein